jgi:hypothetical protein
MKFKIPLLSLKSDAEIGVLDGRRLFALPRRRSVRVPRVAAVVVRGSNGANLIESYHADVSEGTFFGWMTAGAGGGIARTFSIHNVGNAPLKLGHIALEGAGADEFAVLAGPAPVVAPGGSSAFTLCYRARRVGSAVALVLIPSNDPTERPYLFLVEGHATAARE